MHKDTPPPTRSRSRNRGRKCDKLIDGAVQLLDVLADRTPTPVDDLAVEGVCWLRRALRNVANAAARRKARRAGRRLVALLALSLALSLAGCASLDRAAIWLDRTLPDFGELPPPEWEPSPADFSDTAAEAGEGEGA